VSSSRTAAHTPQKKICTDAPNVELIVVALAFRRTTMETGEVIDGQVPNNSVAPKGVALGSWKNLARQP
jgi:hypothetical protein